jgi:hypothetical protein
MNASPRKIRSDRSQVPGGFWIYFCRPHLISVAAAAWQPFGTHQYSLSGIGAVMESKNSCYETEADSR